MVDLVMAPGSTVWTHDIALDGDENLAIGTVVEVTDDATTAQAVVTRRDSDRGYWFLRVIEA